MDYKLGGKKPSMDDLLNGISLQLPLYMYAAKEIIKMQLQKDYKPAGAEIFSLKYKEGIWQALHKYIGQKLPK